MKEVFYVVAIMIMTFSKNPEVLEIAKPSIEISQFIQDENIVSYTDGISFYYTKEDIKAYETVVEMLKELPENVKQGISEIHFEGNNGDILGTAGGSVITLHSFKHYGSYTQKDTLFHEVRTYLWKFAEVSSSN